MYIHMYIYRYIYMYIYIYIHGTAAGISRLLCGVKANLVQYKQSACLFVPEFS